MVIGALLVAPAGFPAPVAVASPAPGGARDLPWRMLAGALLVLTVTFAATRLGPRLSGFFAMFPIMSTVLVGFSHKNTGRGFAVQLLRGMVTGYFAFAAFCVAIALLLREHSVLQAFAGATACALLVQIFHIAKKPALKYLKL